MIYFAVDEAREHLLPHYLARAWGLPLRDRLRQVTYTELFRTHSLERGAWIFTSLDALSHAELSLVDLMQSAARGAGLRVLNSAREGMRRYEFLKAMHRAGLNDFQAHRADGPLEGVRFPVFVRIADEHDGSLTPLLHDHAALRRAMIYCQLRGLSRRQLLVVEFCDTANAHGVYYKYSVFRIGNRFVPRYIQAGSEWMTKSHTSEIDERVIAEEMAYVRENPHDEWVRNVFEIARIEYGRLDYGIRAGRPQAWEINFTPVLTGNINRPARTADQERINALTRPAKDYAHAGIRAGFEGIDPGPMAGEDIEVEFPVGLLEEAVRERRQIQASDRRRHWIDRIAALPGARAAGSVLRWTFGG